jgi:hypothetical protein
MMETTSQVWAEAGMEFACPQGKEVRTPCRDVQVVMLRWHEEVRKARELEVDTWGVCVHTEVRTEVGSTAEAVAWASTSLVRGC